MAGAWVVRPRYWSSLNPVEMGLEGCRKMERKEQYIKENFFFFFNLCNDLFRSVLLLVIFEIYHIPFQKLYFTTFPGVRQLSLSSTRIFSHLGLLPELLTTLELRGPVTVSRGN